jgi:hypothetical protein
MLVLIITIGSPVIGETEEPKLKGVGI